MNYEKQRKLFNFYTGLELMKYLRYSYGTKKYQDKVRQEKIAKFAQNAYRIPFYKKRFDDAGVDPNSIRKESDFIKLPLLTKEEFREWMEEEIAKKENESCVKIHTSGSSGMPLSVLFTPKEYASDIANVLRSMMVAGYNPFFGKTLTEIDSSSEDVGYKTFIQRLGILKREIFDEDWEAEEIIKIVNQYKPNLIRMYKSEMLRVAIYAEQNGIEFYHPDYHLVLGENVDEISERVIRNNWGGKLINLYGCVENGSIAVKKPGDDKYLIQDDACILNVYSSNNQLCDSGKVILTTLYKYNFPLINYDLKDIVVLDKNDRQYIREIKGRENDVIKYSDGTATHWIQMWHIVSMQENILQARFVQESYQELRCEIIIKNASDRDRIINELYEEIQNKEVKGKIHLSIVVVDHIPSDASGKVKMIVSKV